MRAGRGESPEVARWGRGILLAVSALLILNGSIWIFLGPNPELDEMADALGMSTDRLRASHPAAVDFVTGQTQQLAVWFIVFGLLALIVVLARLRRDAPWARKSGWILAAAPASVGVTQMRRGATFAYVMFALSGIALIGQLLARTDPEHRNISDARGTGTDGEM